MNRVAFDLKKVLKAFLFSSGQPLTVKDVQDAIARFHREPLLAAAQEGSPEEVPAGAPETDDDLARDVPSLVTAAQIREAMEEIAAEFRASDHGLLLVEGANGYRLACHPRFARWIRLLRQEPPPVRLSQSALETLAVVAYRQPTTKTEIESIRGVSAEAGLARLLERELIAITGRAELPGRPLQYGTTDKFLEFLGIKSLDELPASDVLSHRQIDEWLKREEEAHKPGDAEMGLEGAAETQIESAAMAGPGAPSPS